MSLILDIGDTYTTRVLVTDDNGALANATNVALLIDGPTTANVFDPVAPTTTGVYDYDFGPTEVGRHTVRWVATGTNACAYSDAFDVVDATAGIVSLSDARDRLNMSSSVSDEELRFYIDSATDYVEGIVGPVVRATYIETHDPAYTGCIPLNNWPVISLTSVVGAYGYTATLDVSTLHVTDAGILEPNIGAYLGCYPLTITYVAGFVVIPELIREAALDYVKWAWESQRGPSGAPFQGDEFAGDQTLPTPPYKIGEKLRRYKPAVVA